MNLRTLKFAKKGNSYLTESKQAIATAFRHYINLAQPSGFSDINTAAHPEDYTPLLYVNRNDLKDNMLYEDDVVFIELPNIYELGKGVWRLCIVGYNEDSAAFGVYDLTPEFEELTFTAFNSLPKDVSSFRLGNLHTDKDFIDKIANGIDNGMLSGEVIGRILMHQKITKS